MMTESNSACKLIPLGPDYTLYVCTPKVDLYIKSTECIGQISPEEAEAILDKVSKISKKTNLARLKGFERRLFITRIGGFGQILSLYHEKGRGIVRLKGAVIVRETNYPKKMTHFELWEKLSDLSKILVI